jgi:hypothetical protein
MARCRIGAGLILIALFAATTEAQQGTSAIRGRILDDQDAVLPGVAIVIIHQETGIFRETVTGADGVYLATNLVAGAYRITAELQGFKKLTRENVPLTAGLTQSLDLKLEIGSVEENVTVTGQAPQVDVTSAAVSENISLLEVQAIPSISHTVVGFLQVVPGAVYTPSTKPSVDGVSVNGQSDGIQHYLDGGANFSSAVGSSFTRVAVPAELIQEISVLTTQMPAEYGGKTGAVINVVSKQGTNAYRGSVYGFYVNDRFVAPDFLVNRNNLIKPETSRKQLGFTVGGPIIENKLFFFGLVERSPLARSSTSIYPANPDKSFTSRSVTDGVNSFFRIDHQINANNLYAVRFLQRKSWCKGDPNCRAGATAGSGITLSANGSTLETLTDEWEWDTLPVINYNRVFGDRKLNVFTFSAPVQSIQTGPPGDEPSADTACIPCLPPTLRYLSFDDQVSWWAHHRWEPHYRFENAFSWFVPGGDGRGSHDLKFGGVYTYGAHKVVAHDAENGIFSFPSNRPYNPADPSTYPERLTIRLSPQNSNTAVRWAGVYAQDKWQLTNQLTVNAGVRYDVHVTKSPNQFNPLFTDPDSYPMDWNNIQPRVGVAYASGDGKAVFRSGYGTFVQGVNTITQYLDQFWRLPVYGEGLVLAFPADRADPGPSSGRLPTDPLLANGPILNRALLNQLFPPGTLIRNPNLVYLDHPDRVQPTSHQATVGYQAEFWSNLTFAADYFHIWTNGVAVQYDLNAGRRATTSRTGAITRVDFLGIADALGISPFSTSVFTYLSDGEDRYDGLNLGLERRFTNAWGGRVSYTLSSCRNNYNASNNFQVLADHNLTWGPCNSDRTHLLNVSGSLEVPRTRGLLVSGSFRYMSALPLTILDSNVDADQNGLLVDPLPAGTYRGSTSDAFTVENEGGWNGARGPASFGQLDLRLGYRFQIAGGRTVEASLDGFNVTNEPNFANPTGDRRQPTFLVPTALSSGGFPRQFQLSGKVTF